MLGDVIYEAKGKRTGRRVLATEPPTVETSFEDSPGTLLGITGMNLGTYTAQMRADGTLAGEGRGVFMAPDGSRATWTGIGLGKLGPGGSVSFRGAVIYNTSSPALAKLDPTGVFEFEVDAQGNVNSKIWAWK